MLATVLENNVRNIGDSIWLGTVGKSRSNKSISNINHYIINLEEPKLVREANQVEVFLAPEIEAIRTTKESRMRDYVGRGIAGYRIACHVFAYLSGKDPLFNDNWLIERRRCANMICRFLGISEMYHVTPEDTFEMKDYGFGGPVSRPIVLKSILRAAYEQFPVDKIDTSLFSANNDGSFDDSCVEVMDVEESLKHNYWPAKTDEVIIDVDPSEIKMVNPDPAYNEAPIEEAGAEKDVNTKEESKRNDGVVPIIFDYDKMNLAPENKKDLTPTQQKKVEELFGPYLKDKKYTLNRVQSGAIECVVYDDKGNFMSYWIDPEMCIGDAYYVLGVIETGNQAAPFDTIPVHQDEKEILKKIFENKRYVLTPEEVQKCMSHMFANQGIYGVVDMSNMNNRLSKLSKEEFRKLGQKLTFIINSLNPQTELGRMRVSEWKGVNSFKLVSDAKCKSPFPGQTMMNITGVSVSVSNDTVVISFNGNTRSTTIDNYGVL